MKPDTDLEFNDADFIEIPQTKEIPKQHVLNHEKRQARRKESGEDFTPLKLVNEILDKLPEENWLENKTFVDPACGNGNMLIEVLKRKLNLKHAPLNALQTIYGAEIMGDNVNECRLRLMRVLLEHVKKNNLPELNPIEIIKILKRNIKWTPIGKHFPNGSLDYDFSFKDSMTDEDAQKTLEKILKGKLLEQVEIE